MPAGGADRDVALGFGLAQLQTWLVAAPVLSTGSARSMMTGRLVAVDPLPEGARLRDRAARRSSGSSPDETPARIRVRLRHGDAGIDSRRMAQPRAVLMPPPAPAMPGAYDFQRRAWFDRLGAVGYALGVPRIVAPPDGAGPSGLVGADRGDAHERHRAHPRGAARSDRRHRRGADRRRDARDSAAGRGCVPQRGPRAYPGHRRPAHGHGGAASCSSACARCWR